MKIETKCLHEGYKPENGGPGVMPIVQSTTYRFDSTAKIASLFVCRQSASTRASPTRPAMR